jgi:DNA polymerase III epsilon subunit-like protein
MIAKQSQIICFDCETGGLDKKTQKHALLVPITQIAFYAFYADDFVEICEDEMFVQPYADLEYQKQALDFTGITMNDINGGISVQQMVQRAIEVFKKALTGHKRFHKPILLGHNVGYDIQFLQYAFNYCGERLENYIQGAFDGYGNFQPNYLDTLHLARVYWAGSPDAPLKYKLGHCAEKLGVELIESHSALPDVRATKDVYQKLIERMRNSSTQATTVVPLERSRTSFKF